MPENVNIGRIVKSLCEEKDITAYELETKCGLSNGTLARWIKGNTPNAAALEKVADYFHVSVDYLIGRTPERSMLEEWNKKYAAKELSKEVKELETIAAHLEDKNLTDRKLKLLTQYIDALFDED